jgi:hypothetical protein
LDSIQRKDRDVSENRLEPTGTEFRRSFDWTNKGRMDNRTSGFTFPVTEFGELIPGVSAEMIENYNKCLTGRYDVKDIGTKLYTTY